MNTIFKTSPMAHQQAAFDRFKDDPAYALLWEMGTGKTKASIDIATHKWLAGLCNRAVIIAPNEVHAQWINEQLPAHCPVPYTAFAYQSKHTNKYMNDLFHFLEASQDPQKMAWLAIHIEAFQSDTVEAVIKRYLAGQKPFWIVDEATRIKNPDAKSVQRLCKLRRKYGGHASALTGSILAKSPVDVWQIIEFIKQGYMGCTHTAFNRRHAILTKQEVEIKRGGRTAKVKVDIKLTPKKFWQVKTAIKNVTTESANDIARRFDITAEDVHLINESSEPIKYKNIDQLKIQISPISYSVKKSECLDLPEKIYQEIVFPVSKEQKQLISDMQKYAVALYGDKELTLSHKASLQVRALQVCGGFFPHLKALNNPEEKALYDVMPLAGKNAKLDYLLHDLEELGDAQFIVWAVFVAELDMLAAELGKKTSVGLLAGSVGKADRDATITAFKAGELQGIVANPVAFGYGHNFQNAGVQYWYSRNYRTEARLQAEDRSHRIGTSASPVYKDLVYDIEFEKAVLRSNKEGKDMNDYFNTTSVTELFRV